VDGLAEAGEVTVTRIGRITAGGVLQLVELEGGRSTLVDAVGYRHFSS
jgi:thiamine monophosphate kinase